ncbi:MAG: hypothetical protein IIW68_03590 [Lachnospiraceae bacterium]|nr:hypothetical protein [Lachnospiraceae bacterium]
MHHKKLFMGVAFAASILTACSGQSAPAFAPTESSLYITSEGTVTSATVETYEADYYSADELKAFIEEVLADFNAAGGDSTAKSASVKECTLADGTAKLLIDFKSADAYLDCMEQYPDEESPIQVTDLDITTVSDGVTKGYLVGKTFTKLGKEQTTAAADEVMKQSKLYVAAIDGAALLQTDGVIQYISEGVSVVGTNLIQTPENEVSYVVFK